MKYMESEIKQRMFLIFFLTNVCNFKCKTCLREYEPPKNLSLKIMERVLSEAKKFWHCRVAFTGGEPCLHPQFRQVIELVAQHGMKFSFVSNGSLLDKYTFLVDEFKDRIVYAGLSLDGATADVHDSIRQEGSFERVKESIKYFSSNGVYTKAKMCVNKLNMHQIEDVVKLSTSLGANITTFTGAIQTSFNKGIVLSDEEKMKCVARINKLRKKYNVPSRIHISLQASHGVNFCRHLNYMPGITVNPDGEFILCCNIIRNGAAVGSLEKTGLVELYHKIRDTAFYLRKLRMRMLSTGKMEPGFNTCEFCNTYLAEYIK